jgi:DNA-binding LacI/PurR family transcriptional regulator
MATIQSDAATGPKYRQVYAALRHAIQLGQWKGGDRLPSEADLVRQFGASRITIGRAVRDLQAAGLVERRAGSGTFVKKPDAATGMSFGLLIPDLGETEIFEPICQGMMASPLARKHALLWGSVARDGTSKEDRAWQLCRQYIDRQVAGVFFAPLELTPGKDEVNGRIASALDEAHIAIVLLDRTALPYPRRGRHDLVGIDNRRAGYVITEHLLNQGSRRVAFVALPHTAATVEAREAVVPGGAVRSPRADRARTGQSSRSVGPIRRRAMLAASRPDAIVCANDHTAALLMQTLLRLEYAVRVTSGSSGSMMRSTRSFCRPLTTLRQRRAKLATRRWRRCWSGWRARIVPPGHPPADAADRSRIVRAGRASNEGAEADENNSTERRH